MAEHEGDEQSGRHGVDHLRPLHVVDGGAIEREHQHVAGDRHQSATKHDHPINGLLTGIEPLCGRMLIADDSAAFPPPPTNPPPTKTPFSTVFAPPPACSFTPDFPPPSPTHSDVISVRNFA